MATVETESEDEMAIDHPKVTNFVRMQQFSYDSEGSDAEDSDAENSDAENTEEAVIQLVYPEESEIEIILQDDFDPDDLFHSPPQFQSALDPNQMFGDPIMVRFLPPPWICY